MQFYENSWDMRQISFIYKVLQCNTVDLMQTFKLVLI